MDKTSLIFSALITLAFVVMMAPGVLAMNRGKVLRNIAIWLAVFAALGFVYTNFGPGSKNPLIPGPAVVIETGKPELDHGIKAPDDAKPGKSI